MPALKPRPPADLSPALEEAAARALDFQRGKSARRFAPPSAGSIAARIVRPLLPARMAASLEDLRARWPEIVGEKLASLTFAEKISGGKNGRVLVIKAAGPAAPFVQHQIPLLLERCNLAGADLASVSILQGAIPKPNLANVRPFKRPLSADEEAALEIAVGGVQNAGLREALLRLGRAVRR